MNTKVLFGLFVAVAVVQLAVPVGQIWKHEDILRTGTVYKFKTAPVDPYDAFRGRYVALNFADTQAPVRKGDTLGYRATAYVTLRVGTNGLAQFGELTATAPSAGDYLRVETTYGTNFRLPFDKFFMEESKAPKAEDAYRQFGNRRGQTNAPTYAVVRVKNGRGVIEDLCITGVPVREFLRAEAAKK
jgi:uncharacterized membrane-anchored protein